MRRGNRIPVITPNAIATDGSSLVSRHSPIDLLRPFGADKEMAWKGYKAVASVKNDSPASIRPPSAAPAQAEESP
jgi:hypothetical protein